MPPIYHIKIYLLIFILNLKKMNRELKNTDFDKNTTASILDLTGIKYDSEIHKLIKKLNTPLNDNGKCEESIMMYGVLCEHDDDCLCECRLQWIVDYMKKLTRIEKINRINE